MSIFKRWFAKRAPAVQAQPRTESPGNLSAAGSAVTDDAQQAVQLAFAHQNAGRLQEAERIYEQVLVADPDHFNALQLLGTVYLQRGEHVRAAEKLEAALILNDGNASVHNNLGECYRAFGRVSDARACYEKALALQPGWSPAAYNLGNLLHAEGKLSEARACYETALRSQPEYLPARAQLGSVSLAQGNLAEAEQCFSAVLRAQPQDAVCLAGLGNVHLLRGEFARAESCYRDALKRDGRLTPAIINLGHTLGGKGELAQAKAQFEAALRLVPDSFDALLGLANNCAKQDLPETAREHFESALLLRPESVPVLRGLASALVDMGEQQAAMQIVRRAILLDPENALLRWVHAVAQVPALFGASAEVAAARAAFEAELIGLDAWFVDARCKEGFEAAAALPPFLLAYHEASNKALLGRYGALCERAIRHWPGHERFSRALPQRSGASRTGRIRVGFVSAHVYEHSVWSAIGKGFVSQLDREQIEVQVFYLGTHVDRDTRGAMSAAEYFDHGARPWQEWAERIAAREPDMLIYPEIGMHATTARLASLRLAPVQAASWGHPETTGLPSMDYFLSAEGLEPPDGREHYTEQMEALANLGCCVERDPVETVAPDLTSLGVDGTLPLLLCPGVPFKYLPENDRVFVEIALRLKHCQFIFFTHRFANLSVRLRHRLQAAFAKAGLDPARFIVFVPWQDKARFHALMKRADVYLDTIGFSGFNTALQAVSCGLPVVTREGRFMRGRLASGILRRMGLPGLIARDLDEYADIAVELASDTSERGAMRRRLAANSDILFDDLAPVRSLEQFIMASVARARSAS